METCCSVITYHLSRTPPSPRPLLHHIIDVAVHALVLEPFFLPRFSTKCLAVLANFNVHLMLDSPRLQLDVDEIIFTWHVSVLAGMCRIAFLELTTIFFFFSKPITLNHLNLSVLHSQGQLGNQFKQINKSNQKRNWSDGEHGGPLPSPSPLVVFEMLENGPHYSLSTSAPLCLPPLAPRDIFNSLLLRAKKEKNYKLDCASVMN